jgi:hypothetical protein
MIHTGNPLSNPDKTLARSDPAPHMEPGFSPDEILTILCGKFTYAPTGQAS